MPFTLPPRIPPGPRRRSLLASAAGAALLVGCSESPDSANTAGSPSAADRARARAARDSAALATRYAAVIAAHPALADLLRPLRTAVVRHTEAFGGSAQASASASASASVSASADGDGRAPASAHPSASASPAVAADRKTALSDLAAAERALADRRTKALLELPGELARLMASVAAAGAAHAFLLTEGAK
ncbi:hypothetical protein AQJ43_35055 [Streptomyces avermitilis]|uniref:Lipoprotein n=1 Tax=Streptomyces avermitilis TaxID=33903 RepID=A0A4D4LMX8_STRAX|nr:hypothetical protein [Streptomyces avermitilis]MYS98161.1 hypothetical protein [Streptomyces sp. SID5469]KUN49977.1 hypothetical protein AQJ43_35055 [Streptomyces avermitilis]OOV33421.1 hypothetical protein SM007_11985 [Streptomyces avermitilis]BBJ50357.1 lipoprotein [Streptomyces avermitilis]GDY62385.1 lipoprotein [Streptomyces avermitilis]